MTVVAVGVVVATLTIADHGESTSSKVDEAHIETVIRRGLLITSTEDPAYPELFCAAFRHKYAGLRRSDVTVYHPQVQKVDHIRIDGDHATADVTAEIGGVAERREFDLEKEDGRWKLCTLDS